MQVPHVEHVGVALAAKLLQEGLAAWQLACLGQRRAGAHHRPQRRLGAEERLQGCGDVDGRLVILVLLVAGAGLRDGLQCSLALSLLFLAVMVAFCKGGVCNFVSFV